MKKRLIILSILALLIILTCIPIFAYNTIQEELRVPPSDLGEIYDYSQYQGSGYAKFYLKIDTQTYFGTNSYYFIDQYAYTNQNYIQIILNNNELMTSPYMSSSNTLLLIPRITFTVQDRYYYIPVYCYQCYPNLSGANNWNGIDIYISSTTDQDILLHEAFQQGYENGYNKGVDDGIAIGQDLEPELNLVGHVEQLMGTFVGEDNARYIVPIALVLIILFVYFLFIRWLLTLINSKNVTKVSDICVCAACLIILIVMYAPMLDLTIKNENINQVETTEAVVENNREQIHVSEYVKYHTETGDIWTLKGVDPPELYSIGSDVNFMEVKNEETTIS